MPKLKILPIITVVAIILVIFVVSISNQNQYLILLGIIIASVLASVSYAKGLFVDETFSSQSKPKMPNTDTPNSADSKPIPDIPVSASAYSCAIAYSSADEEFAKMLHNDLKSAGIEIWFAPEDVKIGDPLHKTIEEAIKRYDKLLIILSKISIGSAWVRREVRLALDKEKEQHTFVLFPIRLDDVVLDSTEQWADDIRRDRHIGDFTKWKNHGDYQNAFDRLLRDLKAEPGKAGA